MQVELTDKVSCYLSKIKYWQWKEKINFLYLTDKTETTLSNGFFKFRRELVPKKSLLEKVFHF
jgi:hypothetical protein